MCRLATSPSPREIRASARPSVLRAPATIPSATDACRRVTVGSISDPETLARRLAACGNEHELRATLRAARQIPPGTRWATVAAHASVFPDWVGRALLSVPGALRALEERAHPVPPSALLQMAIHTVESSPAGRLVPRITALYEIATTRSGPEARALLSDLLIKTVQQGGYPSWRSVEYATLIDLIVRFESDAERLADLVTTCHCTVTPDVADRIVQSQRIRHFIERRGIVGLLEYPALLRSAARVYHWGRRERYVLARQWFKEWRRGTSDTWYTAIHIVNALPPDAYRRIVRIVLARDPAVGLHLLYVGLPHLRRACHPDDLAPAFLDDSSAVRASALRYLDYVGPLGGTSQADAQNGRPMDPTYNESDAWADASIPWSAHIDDPPEIELMLPF